jgi:hypothetical protein
MTSLQLNIEMCNNETGAQEEKGEREKEPNED